MSAPVTVAGAIAAHRAAYPVYIASRTRLWALHEAFDIDHDIEEPEEIKAALTTIHGPHATEEIDRYFMAEAASTAAGLAEDEAWDRVATAMPTTPGELRDWLAYVSQHATKGDEVVTLRRALEHVGGVLADRLRPSSMELSSAR